jgi:hypothetical protein
MYSQKVLSCVCLEFHVFEYAPRISVDNRLVVRNYIPVFRIFYISNYAIFRVFGLSVYASVN